MWLKFSTAVRLFLGICIYRILNTFIIQSFFDPDEYWQTLEPAYCEVFLRPQDYGSPSLYFDCAGYTWEWRRRADPTASWWEQFLQGPVRSYLSVVPTHIYYYILRHYLQWDSHFWVAQGPKILMAVLAAAPSDLSVWIMAHWSTQSASDLPWVCLFCSLVSWFHGYSLVRTFSNSLETMLLSVSMVLIAPELLGRAKNASVRRLRHCLCFFLGGCSVAMRFSSVTAWVPMGILLALQQQQSSTALQFLVGTCAVFGLVGIGLACVVDRYLYGFWTIPFLGNIHFNVLLGNSALYGSHPWHWYLTAGIPAITGLWLPFVLWDLKMLVTNYQAGPTRRNVWIVIGVYTLAHSVAGHKEFRFLLPILPLFCLQAGPHVRSLLVRLTLKQRKHGTTTQTTTTYNFSGFLPWMALMAIPNLIALLYLGLFHQSAPISVNHKIVTLAAAESSQRTYSIHYLTGACHSTPLHSYLHVPGRPPFDTWSLDCSPDCRSNPPCESEQFAQDPVGFVQEAYFSNPTCSNEEEQKSACSSTAARHPPNFLVTYSDYAMKLQPQLAAMGMQEVGRFSHGINGLRIGNVLKTGDGYLGHGGMSDQQLKEMYRRISLLGDFLELSVDEMVLFAG